MSKLYQVGKYNTLKVLKEVDFGFYLDGGTDEILLPTRFAPKDLKVEDELEVFIYHDSENRLIATTQKPKGILDDIVLLSVVDVSPQGAFLDWGLMKDLFVPLSQMESRMRKDESYLVLIYLDEQTGRLAATEKISTQLNNTALTVKVHDEVDMIALKKTDIGYKMIINSKHLGVLHFSELFRDLSYGEKVKGFVKFIRPDNKIDLAMGERGYKKVAAEEQRILDLLHVHDGYLPYHDKSDAEEIYAFFGMSKKLFKMTVGALYKQKKIHLTQTGIKLAEA
jgi:hypothetical protein